MFFFVFVFVSLIEMNYLVTRFGCSMRRRNSPVSDTQYLVLLYVHLQLSYAFKNEATIYVERNRFL